MSQIATALGKSKSSKNEVVEKALKGPSSLKKILNIILVLDEIDFLLKDFNKKTISKHSVFGNILQWAHNPEYRFTLIGISNSVANTDARLLHESTEVRISQLFISLKR